MRILDEENKIHILLILITFAVFGGVSLLIRADHERLERNCAIEYNVYECKWVLEPVMFDD